jgi:hypothetical protein
MFPEEDKTAPAPTAPTLTKEQLLTMEKEDLVDCVLMAMQAQSLFTSNLKKVVDLLEQKNNEVNELKSRVEQQEAELTVLRNKP